MSVRHCTRLPTSVCAGRLPCVRVQPLRLAKSTVITRSSGVCLGHGITASMWPEPFDPLTSSAPSTPLGTGVSVCVWSVLAVSCRFCG